MEQRRVLKTNTASQENRNIPYCHFHQRKGHFLAECKAFENEPLEAKNECILRADTANNLAALATRCMPADKLMESRWTLGPELLWNPLPQPQTVIQEILLDESDPEVKQEVVACITKSQSSQELGCTRFTRFSSWSSIKRAIARLILVIIEFKKRNQEQPKKAANPRPPQSAA